MLFFKHITKYQNMYGSRNKIKKFIKPVRYFHKFHIYPWYRKRFDISLSSFSFRFSSSLLEFFNFSSKFSLFYFYSSSLSFFFHILFLSSSSSSKISKSFKYHFESLGFRKSKYKSRKNWYNKSKYNSLDFNYQKVTFQYY